MSDNRHALGFLVRASILLVSILVIWWLVLEDPLLFLLRISTRVLVSLSGIRCTIADGLAGGWEFHFSFNDPAPEVINAITFTVPRSALLMFTFDMPAYWAIVLAMRVRGQKTARLPRSLVAGSAVVAIVEGLLFATFLGTQVWRLQEHWHPAAGAVSLWAHSLIEYLALYVLPYTAPIVIAVSTHPPLRARIFSSQ
jgi:hypothetical protein